MAENSEGTTEKIKETQLVTFKLGRELFGVMVSQVREIMGYEGVTPVPGMPSFIDGVVNLRGHITLVVNLRRRLRINDAIPEDILPCIVVVENEDMVQGLIVDSVEEVMRVANDSLSPVPRISNENVEDRFITDICKMDDNKLIMLLDLKQVTSDENTEALKNEIGNTNEAQVGESADEKDHVNTEKTVKNQKRNYNKKKKGEKQ